MLPARAFALAATLAAPSVAGAQSPAPAPAPQRPAPAPILRYAPAPSPAPVGPAPPPTAPVAAPTPAPAPADAAPPPPVSPPTSPPAVAPAPPPPGDVGPVPPPVAAPAPAPAPAPVAPVATAPTEPVPATPSAEQPNVRVEVIPPLPRLSLTAGFVFGPHSHGEATCQDVDGGYQCEHTGNFLGMGGTLELRAQLYRPLFLHTRALLVGNLRKLGAHRGFAGGGLGLGAYSRFAFVRGEYMLLPTFGGDNYRPPFYGEAVATDNWGLHAGMFSAGVRKYVGNRASIEAWGGLVVGPRARRNSLSADANDERVIVSFMISLGFTYDLLLARGYVPGAYKPRPRRQWGS